MMICGSLLALLFSYPMVQVLTVLGDTLNLDPFYIAFIFTPVLSNIDELVASLN